MANEDVILKEVDQELNEERQWAMFRKYGPAAIGAALAIVVGVGAKQFVDMQKTGVAKEQALEYSTALDLVAEDEAGGRDALAALAQEGKSGYSVLAQFHRAGSFAREGKRVEAIAAFRALYNSSSTPNSLKELARVRAAYLALADGRESVLEHLDNIALSDSPFSYYAKEISGLAALRVEDYETSLSQFRALSVDLGAPIPIRERAEDFAALALAGKSGVNITGKTRVEDLLEAFDESAGSDDLSDLIAPDPLSHEGHDHSTPASVASESNPEEVSANIDESTEAEDDTQSEQ